MTRSSWEAGLEGQSGCDGSGSDLGGGGIDPRPTAPDQTKERCQHQQRFGGCPLAGEAVRDRVLETFAYEGASEDDVEGTESAEAESENSDRDAGCRWGAAATEPIRALATECATRFCNGLGSDARSGAVVSDEVGPKCLWHFQEQGWFGALPARLKLVAIRAAGRVLQERFGHPADGSSHGESGDDS